MDPSSPPPDAVDVVEHLVKDDPLDEPGRHVCLIEGGVDANQPRVGRVGAKLDRPSRQADAGDSAPGDRARESPSEVATAELVEVGLQVVVTAPGAQGKALAALVRRHLPDQVTVRLDVTVEQSRRLAVSRSDVAGERFQYSM